MRRTFQNNDDSVESIDFSGGGGAGILASLAGLFSRLKVGWLAGFLTQLIEGRRIVILVHILYDVYMTVWTIHIICSPFKYVYVFIKVKKNTSQLRDRKIPRSSSFACHMVWPITYWYRVCMSETVNKLAVVQPFSHMHPSHRFCIFCEKKRTNKNKNKNEQWTIVSYWYHTSGIYFEVCTGKTSAYATCATDT